MDGRLYLSKQAHKIYQENCVEGKLFSQFTDMFFGVPSWGIKILLTPFLLK